MTNVNINKTIRTDKQFSVSMVAVIAFATLAILTIGLTATTVQAAGPSGCPDPGHCTCINGVMHDDLMPDYPINNGCTEPAGVKF
jgi:hypothetical protein